MEPGERGGEQRQGDDDEAVLGGDQGVGVRRTEQIVEVCQSAVSIKI